MAAGKGGKGSKPDPPGLANLLAGQEILSKHPGFRHIKIGDTCGTPDCKQAPRGGMVVVDSNGYLHPNLWNRADPMEWAWALAHANLHLGFGHLPACHEVSPEDDLVLRAAQCVVVNRFLRGFKVGTPPFTDEEWPAGDEETLAAAWRASGGVPERFSACGSAGSGPDQRSIPYVAMYPSWPSPTHNGLPDWADQFSMQLTKAIAETIEAAAHRGERRKGPWDAALEWFVASFPLLGAIAARLRLVADADLARSSRISIAAVDAHLGEIYVNPLIRLTPQEWRFVLAHEMLHAALRHGDRVGGRDPYLWNVACDYVINAWLLEMAVGAMPDGLLYDPELAGLSAEQVYDRIAHDLRRLRKLATLRGRGLGDVLTEPLPRPDEATGAVDLDDFYRRALLSGRAYHETKRGLLPAGLAEEIRALEQPPIPWDAKLARWFDEHIPADHPQRSYARPSRRQSSTPDIPRPGRLIPTELTPRRTFGVVLDTSMSMDRQLLGKALGAIASYALAHDVPAARIVYCDAFAYDAGYLPVEQIADRAQVKGRGGTVLQPGVDLLLRAQDFPADAPILVITDGECDPLIVRREHAFVLPRGASLPFSPRGEVFELR